MVFVLQRFTHYIYTHSLINLLATTHRLPHTYTHSTMANKNNDQDMFSYLTDSLILIIISFLPVKNAARTSTLSKRWQFLWHETKNIELDKTLFVKPQNHQSNEETIGNQRRVFIDFSMQFIRGFRPVSHANFVQFAIGHNAKVLEHDFSKPTWDQQDFDLDLDNNHADLFELPPCVYEHKEPFKSLKLFACKFRVFQFINFSALTSLSLSLSLKKCWNLENLNISTARLRTLVIDKCWSLENGISIETSKLLFFKYSGPMNGFMIDYLNALVEADLDFGFETEFGEYGDILYDLLRDTGFMVAMISNLAFVFRNIFSKKGMKGKSVGGMNLLSLLILTPFAIAVEGPQMWAVGWQNALAQIGPQFIWQSSKRAGTRTLLRMSCNLYK
ncbi:unnamed protein product [Camellia sinensis]